MKNKYKEISKMRTAINNANAGLDNNINSAFEYLVDPKMLKDMADDLYQDSNMTHEQKIVRFFLEQLQESRNDSSDVFGAFHDLVDGVNWDKVNKIK